MCNFFSVLVLKNGDILSHPMLDSHADLVQYFHLPDDRTYHQHFAKVELTPVDWMDVASWKFKLDEETKPEWWDDIAVRAETAVRRKAETMILRDQDRSLIVDGCWIVGGKSKIRDVRSGRIVRVQGNASVQGVWGNASVRDVWDNASVRDVGDNASVQDVWGNAKLDDSAKARQK